MFSFNNYFNNKTIKRFYIPTKFFFGKDSRNLLFNLCSKEETTILLVSRSFGNDFLVKRFKKEYKNTIVLTIHGEPDMTFIDQKLKEIPKNLDCIVAIGGGSVIDSAKAIYAEKIYGNYKQLGYGRKKFIEPINNSNKITFIALPTTAGSGSEASRYYLISDDKTKEKTVSRSWLVCPEYAILDPYFLENAPKKVLILGAFDAFIHLFETFICRYEQSMFNDILILDGIPRILKVMDKILSDKILQDDDFTNLQFAATLGGISITNVRTGLMHDIGEAFSAKTNLIHPETLFVFLEAIMGFYDNNNFDKKNILIKKLNQENIKLNSLKKIGAFWRKIFEKENLINNLKEKLSSIKIDKNFILNKVIVDKVLVAKESPVKLNKKNILEIIDKSFKLFKISS